LPLHPLEILGEGLVLPTGVGGFYLCIEMDSRARSASEKANKKKLEAGSNIKRKTAVEYRKSKIERHSPKASANEKN
jgi:hypothetical protein